MSVSSMSMIEKFKPHLIKKALTMRESGASHEAIARMMSDESGVEVGRESVRKWFKGRE